MKLQNLQILDLRCRGVTVTSQNVLQICSVKRCILRPGFNNVNMRRQMKKKKKIRLRKENIEQRQSWRRKDKRAGNRAAGTETMFSEKVEVSVETTISSSSSSVLRFH